ncbi:Gfo/Idh/MocA family protein [Nonomuraea zeae]|uniref:Gfo/Idh/MocA family oxidoreductase n=1 Tax=Nonomuraea zeae TaxID=1642303 RepID=A0A5S4FV15_9ACTN|nr:Gfo/Idh/MocA family oxidoreductase [Nonomuraea zeae]TMR24617.1 Gfo/Idh/MocA family oxidoreductase [Nonomuraea zeae]
MSAFADPARPLRVVQVGAGSMGLAWLRTLTAAPGVELVGVADLDPARAEAAVRAAGADVKVDSSLGRLLAATDPDAVVNVTVPAAHAEVNIEALFAGIPVLCEKPAAPTLAEAIVQVAAAEAAGRLLMISQSRRYFAALAEYRRRIGELGTPGLLTTEFFRGPRFGGFRDEMEQPLLVDMAIHAFDAARHLLGAEPVSVMCESWNPAWSWYRGDAAATATFLFDDGTRYVFTGAWCADGLETSWNGRWRAVGSAGTATWDGEDRVTSSLGGEVNVPRGAEEQIAGALAEFVAALRTGARPSGAIARNLRSLAMVEAAVRSAESGTRVRIGALLDQAHQDALALPVRAEIRERLLAWEPGRTD